MNTARPRLVSTSIRKLQLLSPSKRVKSSSASKEEDDLSPPPSMTTTTTTTENMAEAAGTQINEDASNDVLGQPPTKFTEADLQAIKLTSDTLKRNPKMDFSKSDLLKLLSYLEGELQARDVVIAVLKTEKVKQLLSTTRYSKSTNLNDPHAALYRDNLASSGTIASRQSSIQAAYSEHEMRLLNDQRVGVKEQMDSLATLVMQQRQTQAKMVEVLKDAEERYKQVVQELEEERRKHEHTTAQGDDITYGLEIERSRLKQELEHEKEQRKVLELEVKKIEEQFEAEKNRQKQIVLLLLAERKKIIIKYIEERKRSEDLAQILSEEKQRVDTIAEGLEEESKKSLRMEAELETQAHQFDMERKILHQSLAKEEKRIKEQDIEIQQLRAELEVLRKQTGIRHPIIAPQLPIKPGGLMPSRPSIGGVAPDVDSVVSSTSSASAAAGSAVAPGACTSAALAGSVSSGAAAAAAASAGVGILPPGAMISSVATKVVQPTATVSSVPVSGPTTGIARSVSPGQLIRQTAISQLSVTSPPIGSGPVSNSAPVAPGSETYANATPGKMATVRKASTSPAGSPAGIGFPSTGMGGSVAALKKTIIPPVGGRGVPPPIPPNKPQIPPKLSATSAAAAVAAAAVSSRIPFLNNSNHSSSISSNNISNNLANCSSNIGASIPSPSSVSSPLSSSPSSSSSSSSTNSASSTFVAPPGLNTVSGTVPPTNNFIASSTVANNATAGATTAAAATNFSASAAAAAATAAAASKAVAVSAAAAATASQNSAASNASAFVSTAAEILTNIGCEGGIV
ncbi:CTTNBP2 N-terminal-like protein isoform X2 [Topomyia yanbarensis]|uniref:CTTNBP2 N-terminal-like protein isoform X2 n=1 Tax=Topomyia yanbarensis TaxID=2498891 RepID=UPI00273B26C0|nr:CTTNBP2 N-terminal-like protein isoform X2 [Topomyia yanbarensis]